MGALRVVSRELNLELGVGFVFVSVGKAGETSRAGEGPGAGIIQVGRQVGGWNDVFAMDRGREA